MVTASYLLNEYQEELLRGYRCLRAGNGDGYAQGLYLASRIAEKARGQLSKRKYVLFEKAAVRSSDVLRKCNALGLANLEKRLGEFRLCENLSVILGESNPDRRRELFRLAA